MIIVNKHTVELARKEAGLAYRKCRLVILGVIKRESDSEWKQKHIEALENIRPEELKYVNS